MDEQVQPSSDVEFRILVATDCHLGYMEKDEVRRDDSFAAFEEICRAAQEREVDFMLLGGDLFHENKPSRSTLVRTIEILRRYCLNDRPVQFQVVSDQTVNFSNVFGHVNFEDPHFNVGMPLFTIHGNHDDPAGVDNLSAIDILSTCNLVNYFGKTVLAGSGVGQITIHPILLRKGSTSLALYGLGNIRDERLNRMFQTPHAVQWVRPAEEEDSGSSDWFNIFVLHQNRVKSNPKNAISEHLLPRFLDLVIWGHEHECLVEPQEVAGMGFHVTQPGSSVATSLIDGEAKPKHALLLEVKGNIYRPTKIPLNSVRPFEFADVTLNDEPDLDPNDQSAVLQFLDSKVQSLIEKAAGKRGSSQEPMVPLVRVRVDYTGFSTVNPQRFGQKFVGKVANPHDLLIFTKAAKKRTVGEGEEADGEPMRPEELNQQSIEALVHESKLSMEILPVTELGLALHEFVSKDDKQAFHSCVKANLDDTQSKLVQEAEIGSTREEDVLTQKLNRIMQHRETEVAARLSSGTPVRSQATDGSQSGRSSTLRQSTIGEKSSTKKPRTREVENDDEDFAEAPMVGSLNGGSQIRDPVPPTLRGRGRGSRGKGVTSSQGLKQTTLNLQRREKPTQRAAAKVAASVLKASKSDEVEDDISDDDSGDADVAGSMEEEAARAGDSSDEQESLHPPSTRGRGRKRAAPSQPPLSTNSRRGASKRGRVSKAQTVRSKGIVEDDEEDAEEEPRSLSGRGGLMGTASQSSGRVLPGGRKWGSLRK